MIPAQPSSHVVPISPIVSTSPWISPWASSASGWGATHISRVPGPAPGLHYTVIPLPAAPVPEITMQCRADAIAATYSGWIQEAVDLYRLTVERNGFMRGVLDTMTAILALPLAWQGGTPEMRSALQDQDGTPGDYTRMHPENECAKIFSDGCGIGFGLGQYLLMCWRCDGVEWNRVRPPLPAELPIAPGLKLMAEYGDERLPAVADAKARVDSFYVGREIEVCRTCGARRIDRPPGQRELHQLRWRDARWLWRNPVTLQWYYTGRQGMIPINPGDGEWFLFRTVPDQDIWSHGPWHLGTEAAIMARDATYDEANTAAVCAPTHVFKAKENGGTDPKTRRDVESQADQLRFNNKLVLPGEWDHRIDAATTDYVDAAGNIKTWASDAWEVALTGHKMGQQSGTGFANMDVYQRVTTRRRQFLAGSWIRQVITQGLKWWGVDNYASRNVPVGVYDCKSPEEKLAEGKGDEQEGTALRSMREGLDAVGYELEPAYVEERAQRRGYRVRPKEGGDAAKITLGVEAVMACLRGGPALDSLGVPRFGDGRDDLTLAQLAALPPGGAPPPPPGGPGMPMPPAPPAARVEEPDDEDDEGEANARAAALADSMNATGKTACRHNRGGLCRYCRVRGVWSPTTEGWAVTWEPVARHPCHPVPRVLP